MTSHVINYTRPVSRWQPDARERLERAALELFAEQGFAATTVPEITARAGLTTRTFFRHFADKREVLFSGEEEVPGLVTQMMADAPAALDPVTLIVEGLKTIAETRFEGRREELREKRQIVRTDESLRERNLRKLAALRDAIHTGFVARGVAPLPATLLAEISVTLLNVSLNEWLDQTADRPLFDIVLDTLESLQTTVADFPARHA
ncbi:TetR/AcrR family transcriptional regulator [Kribbella ginsengisoli]|uniref:TetR/AcrR family transcriptional regulator n=1 Tax=Kribbella ginsengisoli TaxID=363865 RepID=A0ABP6YGM4_9ACTN